MNRRIINRILIILIPIILIAGFILVGPAGNKEIKISKVSLFSENRVYSISFEASNVLNEELNAEIEASVYFPFARGKGGGTWEVAGIKKFTIHIAPREKKQFIENIDLFLPPKIVPAERSDLRPQVRVLRSEKVENE